MTTRAEHIAWCKSRALAHAKQGELSQAVASMVGDLTKHDETIAVLSNPFVMGPGQAAAVAGDAEAVIHWIEGF